MVYETDNAESRIGQTSETLTNGDGLVSEAYSGMEALSKQQRGERQSTAVAGDASHWLEVTDPYRDLNRMPPPRTERLPQPAPRQPLELDHEEARRRGAEGDRRAAEQLQEAGRRRHGRVPQLRRHGH